MPSTNPLVMASILMSCEFIPIGRVLTGGRERVRREPCPACYTDVYAVFNSLLPEILLPYPAWNVGLDRIGERIDPKAAISAKDERPEVALLEAVRSYNLKTGSDQLIHRIADLHAIDVARVPQPRLCAREA